jgi:sigma-54 dependent transcriptional regulator, acetoin dehydrogenase operon transcriptional activator AcoR
VGPDDPRNATTTLEHRRDGAGHSAPRALGPLLFRLLCGDDLSQPPARYSLASLSEVDIGRASPSGAAPREKALRIELSDPFASSNHAHLERGDGGWRVRDEDSRNGTLVNDQRAQAGEQVPLRDGDLIEIGHTFFLFRGTARGVSDSNLEPMPGEADPATLRPEWEVELAKAARLSRTAHEILIEGESGAGKEVLARLLHEKSRRTGQLVSVNCAALPETLFEDELFGHVRGAFSGAHADRDGLIRAAEGGTLFLDEVGEMPLGLQVKLLRVLEDHQVRPLGSEREISVDVRMVAASNRSLEELVAQGKFRQDLLARLGLLSLRVPALRERREDLGLLIRAVLRQSGTPLERVGFDLDALRLLLRYSWPLNVRELRRALLAAVDLAGAEDDEAVRICPHHLPEAIQELRASAPAGSAPGDRAPATRPREPKVDLTDAERDLRDSVIDHLRRANGNVSDVARQMGKGRTQIHRWIVRFGIDVEALRRTRE